MQCGFSRFSVVLLGVLLLFPSHYPLNASSPEAWQPKTKKTQRAKKKATPRAKSHNATNKSARAAKPRRDVLSVADVTDVERRLNELGYWTGPIDGNLDEATKHALFAFQKVTGRPRTGRLTRAERSAVMRASRPDPREKGDPHIEIDLRRQVLFVVDELGVVTRILPVSTGSGADFFAEGFERTATTPSGRFNIQGKVAGWRKSALGRLYYPNYIIGGIAIHGYPSVPAKPASHGCIRIPMFAAKAFSWLVPIGMSVIVHDGKQVEEVLSTKATTPHLESSIVELLGAVRTAQPHTAECAPWPRLPNRSPEED